LSSPHFPPRLTPTSRSIIRRTHAPGPLRQHLLTASRSALRRPLAFLSSAPYLLITTLYLSTFLTANLTDTLTASLRHASPATVYAGSAKFLATSAANMAVCLYKDARFAKLYGAATAGAASPVPRLTFALFGLRDCMTVFASFNVPPVLGPMLGSAAAAQFVAPASVQFLSTPFHLLGLDLYNRRAGGRGDGGREVGARDRWQRVRRDWMGASLARIGRIVPAFGVGGVVNAGVRRRLMGLAGGSGLHTTS